MRFAIGAAAFAALAALPSAARAQNSAALIKDGRTQWLRYDARANQINLCPGVAPSLDSAAFYKPDPRAPGVDYPPVVAMQRLHSQLLNCPRPTADVGSAEYQKAEDFFRQAYAATPADPRAFRQLAMLLAERARWMELQTVAREQTKRDPSDPWAYLAIGLALHRSGKSQLAAAVFDSGAMLMTPAERGRLFTFAKLLDKPDSIAFEKSNAAAKASNEKAFWAAADPLWSRKAGDPRTEFLARVTFAELRWTVEEQRVRGADSDRGETYIRFGPPDRVFAMRGSEIIGETDPARQQMSTQRDQNEAYRQQLSKDAEKTGMMMPQPSDVVTWWDYNNGLTLVFWGAPTYGTAKFPTDDQQMVAEVVELRSTSFDNVAHERILPMGTQVARFRAEGGDSVDVLVVAQAPMAAIQSGASNAAVRGDFWLVAPNAAVQERDSSTFRPSGIDQRVFRVPAARYGFRVEATTDASQVAARALGFVNAAQDNTGFTLRGFSISDPILAAVARANTTPPKRWTDFAVAPLIGMLPQGRNLEIIWENYELGAKDAQAQYTVSVTLQRERSAAGRVTATILGFAANAVGVDRRDDRVTFKFDRTMAPSPVVVDQISIAMGDTPPGEYRVTLEVSDKASGRKTSRTIPLVIGQ